MISSTQQFGTNVIAALAMAGSCTAGAQAEALIRRDELMRPGHRAFIRPSATEVAAAKVLVLDFPRPATAAAAANDEDVFIKQPRNTTEREQVLGELRKLRLLESGWDGEGAAAPIRDSLRDAENFMLMLPASAPLPEPMMLPNGRAGLYWNDGQLYADLEFIGDGRVSYYVERRDEGKHKGAVKIRTKEMPAVFEALLRV